MKYLGEDGVEVEAFTAEERDAHTNAIVEQKLSEERAIHEAKLKERDEISEAQKGNIGRLRVLTETQKNELSEAQKTIYENQQSIEQDRVDRENADKARADALLDAEVKAKSNGNPDLEKKIRDNLSLINIDARTPEQITAKVALARGGVFEQNPDMLAVVGGYTGSVYPGGDRPTERKESFADTPQGKAMGEALGLTMEVPK